jgi:hypothetical protein
LYESENNLQGCGGNVGIANILISGDTYLHASGLSRMLASVDFRGVGGFYGFWLQFESLTWVFAKSAFRNLLNSNQIHV